MYYAVRSPTSEDDGLRYFVAGLIIKIFTEKGAYAPGFALSFAAGAMIFVVVEELVPESQRGGNTDLATGGAMIGFAAMMLLDVAFG